MIPTVIEEKCPRCGRNSLLAEPEKSGPARYVLYNKRSRRDNQTYVCNACGTEEALSDYQNSLKAGR